MLEIVSLAITVFVLIIFVAVFGTLLYSSVSFAPWVPTKKKDRDRIFRLANLKPDETFYDLGCGAGGLVIEATTKYQAVGIGIELSLIQYTICRLRELFIKNNKVFFKNKNFFKEDLSKADVVYFFGYPATIKKRLKQKLEKELKSGARVISYAFQVPDWQPKIVDKPEKESISIYYYVIE